MTFTRNLCNINMPFSSCCLSEVIELRNNATRANFLGRQVALLAASIVAVPFLLIEGILSIAFAILLSPMLLSSYRNIPASFLVRGLGSICSSGYVLTVLQYKNFRPFVPEFLRIREQVY